MLVVVTCLGSAGAWLGSAARIPFVAGLDYFLPSLEDAPGTKRIGLDGKTSFLNRKRPEKSAAAGSENIGGRNRGTVAWSALDKIDSRGVYTLANSTALEKQWASTNLRSREYPSRI